MEIIYKIGDFPDPGDRDVFNGIQEINKNNYIEALKHFEKGSNYDNEYALLFSAVIYYNGAGINKREPAKAMDLCKKVVSEWNNYVAQYLVGLMYIEGDGDIPLDIETGVYWISLSAERGWPYAIATMGNILSGYVPCKTDEKKAITWLEKLAKKDNNETEIIKDKTFYLFGNKNLEVDFTHANQKFMKWVQENWLGIGYISPFKGLYEITIDTLDFENYQRIVIWDLLTEKESSGVVASQSVLSKIYLYGGSYVPKDFTKALYWTKMAAKKNSAAACLSIGKSYVDCYGYMTNFKESIKWYHESYILGSIEASFYLGLMYYKGAGFKKDFKKALYLFNSKVNRDNRGSTYLAYFYMGEIYRTGRKDDVPQDYKAAYVCYETAFELGHDIAAIKIAGFYCEGLGVEKDEAKTIEWLRKSAASVDRMSSAQDLLNIISENGYVATEHIIAAQLDYLE
ncbi:hypothetical protein BD770DRAFT_476214 [Pilaira anomala]|nr:hypothetical protein BD770DRAFT_476214 [Pilaira anomala]